MKLTENIVTADAEGMTDEVVVDRVKAGDTALYEIIMRRYNQRLYRVASAILRDSAEAEDVMQDAYVRAYQYLHQFAGESSFSIWLTRIAVNESLRRLRLRKRISRLDEFDPDDESLMNVVEMSPNPEQAASSTETTRILEQAILDLPYKFRAVVMLRDVEQMSTAETAAALELSQENVKVRLHRGHTLMRDWVFARLGESSKTAFGFMGDRCNNVVVSVFARIERLNIQPK